MFLNLIGDFIWRGIVWLIAYSLGRAASHFQGHMRRHPP